MRSITRASSTILKENMGEGFSLLLGFFSLQTDHGGYFHDGSEELACLLLMNRRLSVLLGCVYEPTSLAVPPGSRALTLVYHCSLRRFVRVVFVLRPLGSRQQSPVMVKGTPFEGEIQKLPLLTTSLFVLRSYTFC